MKKNLFIQRFALITSLFLATAFQGLAQPGPPGGRGGILTEEQRTKLREAIQSSSSELSQLAEKLAAAQKEAIKAALADKPDESTVRAKIEAVAKIQTEMAMLRFKGVREIKATFTDEQKARMDERPTMGYLTLFGGFPPFGGGRRGPGPGSGGGPGNN